MRPQHLHIEESEAVVREHLFDRQEREVGEVLMVDGVELIVRHQAQQVRKLHRQHAVRLQQDLHSCHKIVEVGNVRQHIISQQQIGGMPLSSHFPCRLHSEK